MAPRRHVEDVVRDFTPDEYLALQAVVHRVARAINDVVATERTYVLSLGTMQGNATSIGTSRPCRQEFPTSSSSFTH